MSIQYAASRTNATFVTVTKADIMTNLETQLLAAGWSTVSGHGTTNLLMQSAATPQGLAIRARIKDNAGVCVQISIETVDGAEASANNTTNGGSIKPGFTTRVIANPFQFLIYAPNNYGTGCLFAMVSCPSIPAPLVVPAYAGLMLSDSTSDNGGIGASFRTRVDISPNGSTMNSAAISGANLYQNNNSNVAGQTPALFIPLYGGSVVTASQQPSQWGNGNIVMADTLMTWFLTNATTLQQIRAQLWDTIIVYDAFNGDTTATFDGHNWLCVTNLNTANVPKASLFVAVP